MSELFSIQLQNRQQQGRDGIWLDLPTTTEQVQAALRQIGISSDNPQGLFISGYFAEEDVYKRQPYHLQRGGVRALCDAGAFPERRGHVLRHQRKIPQHDHAGPQAGPVSQRPKAGYARRCV